MTVNIIIFLFNYKTIYGYKNMAKPFVQYFLPPDFKFEKKGNRNINFFNNNGPNFKGTSRSKEAALAYISSWLLSDDQGIVVRSTSIAKRANSRNHPCLPVA